MVAVCGSKGEGIIFNAVRRNWVGEARVLYISSANR